MKALVWHGKHDVRVDEMPEPRIEEASDILVRVTSTAICGSDLHLLDGYVPEMRSGDILGHEFMGEVVDVGGDVQRRQKGDRVVVPFVIACGECFFCNRELHALCDNTNRDAETLAKLYGHASAGLFGYSHLFGGYAGGQAEYVRVPHADKGPIKVPASLSDEEVLFLSDILPTGWMADNCELEGDETVAVWGAGPVGQMAIKSAWLQGAAQVIAIDHVPERLEMARSQNNAEIVDFSKDKNVYERLQEMTGGRGPDCCIDAVGFEAHGWGSPDAIYDRVKVATYLATDRAHALREAIFCCRKGGTVSVPGVYAGMIDKMPWGAAFGKGLSFKMGQTHAQRYMRPLLERIERGELDPSFVITHRLKLEDGPAGYAMFRDKKDGCIKIVMTP